MVKDSQFSREWLCYDMIAQKLGMKVFLLTDCIINKKNVDISIYPHGSFGDLDNFLNTLNI